MQVAIVKYNAGNIYSVVNALRRLGVEPLVTDDKEQLLGADRVVFPGQGEASGCMKYLREHKLDSLIKDLRQPVLGICVGQQLLCRHSEEGDTDCIGIFDADVKRFHPQRHEDKVPCMGWNSLHQMRSELFSGLAEAGTPATNHQSPLRVLRTQLLRAPVRPHRSHGKLHTALFCGHAQGQFLCLPVPSREERTRGRAHITQLLRPPTVTMIELIPAIDLIDGKCVRLTKGDYDCKTVYNEDPVAQAKEFERLGFKRLHVVDLDGAKSRHVVNDHVLRAITSATSLVVDFGGGIKTEADIEKAFSAGAAMVTVGSIAVTKPELFLSWLDKYGAERLILGADVRGGKVSINGWKEDSQEDLLPFLRRYVEHGVSNVLCTEISKDGTLAGPATELYKRIMAEYPYINLIASGGVSSTDDILALQHEGIPSVVFGKAYYEGRIDINRLPMPDSNAASPITTHTLAKRIIPCLDVKNGETVKGTNFVNLRSAGDPVELGKAYSDAGADELVFLDITASFEERKTFTEMVERVAREINIPFTVGGGINELSDVERLLHAGADKVSINSAALRRPELINEIASHFGSQVCVVAIDARNDSDGWHCYVKGGRQRTERGLFEWAKEAEQRGAGEILFTSMDHDGVKQGFANDALSRLSESLSIPIIASGGAGSMEHFRDAFTLGKADAALAASVFHFGEIAIPDLKHYLSKENINVRL